MSLPERKVQTGTTRVIGRLSLDCHQSRWDRSWGASFPRDGRGTAPVPSKRSERFVGTLETAYFPRCSVCGAWSMSPEEKVTYPRVRLQGGDGDWAGGSPGGRDPWDEDERYWREGSKATTPIARAFVSQALASFSERVELHDRVEDFSLARRLNDGSIRPWVSVPCFRRLLQTGLCTEESPPQGRAWRGKPEPDQNRRSRRAVPGPSRCPYNLCQPTT